MTVRTFRHAVTGRSIQVREDSRAERLVEADDNWTESKKSTGTKEASDGSGNAGGRRGGSRSGSDDSGSKPRRKSARKG